MPVDVEEDFDEEEEEIDEDVIVDDGSICQEEEVAYCEDVAADLNDFVYYK